jgi:nitroimidazol reductase NimA-like FMN-containing flavoprotein (pyridoxamine 5'-phosphate oxidase superfamily)
MARWKEVGASAPEFADRVQALFDAGRHKTLATLRRDGSPRISGIEAAFAEGELWLGSMPASRKGQDLRRDPRMALHSPSFDPPDDPTQWGGDAKVSGRAIEVTDDDERQAFRRATGQEGEGPGTFELFRIDIEEVVRTSVGDPPDHLVIELWRPGGGLTSMRRT